MSNMPNEDVNANSGSGQNSGNSPSSSNYGFPQQGPYGTTPNYPPPPGYYGAPQNSQEQYGMPPNYPSPSYPGVPQGPQGQYRVPPNDQQPYSGQPHGQYGYGANPYGPQVGYGYGYNNPNMPPPVSTPLPLGEAIRQLPNQYVRVTTKPGVATFAAEQGKATWNIVWVQIIVLTLFTVLFGFVFANFTLPAQFSAQNIPTSTVDTLRGYFNFLPFSYILITPISYFIGLGIYHLIAKAFGGSGTFLAYMYSYLLFNVPLTVVSLLLSLIPIVGGLIAGAVGIYGIVLQVFMTMAVHRLSGGRATFAVLLLPIIALVLVIVLFIIIIAIAISAAQHVR